MRHPDLSIVILTWNTKPLVVDCLGSIYGNVRGISFEVILVVNGSTDGTQAAVRDRYPQVMMIENAVNVGFTRGNNMGIRETAGRHVLLLNDDTIVLPGALEGMVHVLDGRPDVGAVGPQLLGKDGAKQNAIHAFPSLLTELVPPFLLELLFPGRFPSKRISHEGPVEVPAVLGAAMTIRREALDRVGLLDEGFFSYLEETDWLLRAKRAGYKTVFLPESSIHHIHGASSKKKFPGPSRVEFHRSLYRFFEKHHGQRSCALLVALKWIGLSVNVLSLSIACLFTAFRKERLRIRLRSYVYLLAWHAKGRPPGMGLAAEGIAGEIQEQESGF